MLTNSPKEFAEWFSQKYPGSYRQIITDDIKDLTECGLIHHHGYYSGSEDGETIRGILQYEQLRENQLVQ